MFKQDSEGPGAEIFFIFVRFWKDAGGPGVETFDFRWFGFGTTLEGSRLTSLIFVRFWNDFGWLETDIFDSR